MGYRSIASISLLSMVVFAGDSVANTLKIKPSLKFTHVYSDNLQVNDADKVSDQISQLIPSIHLTNQGAIVESNVSYQYTRLWYKNNSVLNKGVSNYNGTMLFKLFDERLKTTLSASKRRQQSSLFQPQSLLSDSQKTDVIDYNIQNQFRSRIDDYANYQIDWHLNNIKTKSEDGTTPPLADSDSQRISLFVNDGRFFDRSFWSLSANKTHINYDETTANNGQSQQGFENYSVEVGHEIYQDISFYGQYYDENYDINNRQGSNLGSSSYGAGFRWQPSRYTNLKIAYNWTLDDNNSNYVSAILNWIPSPRTTLQLSAGKRFFGDAYQALFSHRLKRISTLISYSENVINFQSSSLVSGQVGNFICPATQDYVISDCSFSSGTAPSIGSGQQLIPVNGLTPELTNTTYLNKQYLANISYHKRIVNVSLNYTNSERMVLDTQEKSKRQAISLSFSYQFNRNNNVNFSSTFEQTDSLAQQQTNQKYRQQNYTLSYTQRTGRSLSLTTKLIHRSRNSQDSISDYEENRIALSLQKGF